jgi:hypothetical protein
MIEMIEGFLILERVMKILMSVALMACLVISGCNEEGESTIQIGEVLSSEDKRRTIDRRSRQPHLPAAANNITYLGNDWYTFKLQGACFLIAQHGRDSVMAAANVCDE